VVRVLHEKSNRAGRERGPSMEEGKPPGGRGCHEGEKYLVPPQGFDIGKGHGTKEKRKKKLFGEGTLPTFLKKRKVRSQASLARGKKKTSLRTPPQDVWEAPTRRGDLFCSSQGSFGNGFHLNGKRKEKQKKKRENREDSFVKGGGF